MDHYAQVADTLHEAWFYEPESEYARFVCAQVVEALGLASPHVVRQQGKEGMWVDMGGGNGDFAVLVRQTVRERVAEAQAEEVEVPEVLVVEPSAELLARADGKAGLGLRCADALAYVQGRDEGGNTFNKMWLKEAIHHIPVEQLDDVFRGLFGCAVPATAAESESGEAARICVVTRLPDSSGYPFFAAAHEEWRKHQDAPESYVEVMERAGFRATYRVAEFLVDMSKARWFRMVRNRFWSTFSAFSDDEIEQGLQELDERFPGDAETTNISFRERLAIITASLPETA